MVKSFIDVIQDSSRRSLGIPVTTKNLLSRTSLPLGSLRMASFTRAISCSLLTQVCSLWSRKASCLSFAHKCIAGMLARTSTALVNTVRYAEIILIAAPQHKRANCFPFISCRSFLLVDPFFL